jgi:hypothetical protein
MLFRHLKDARPLLGGIGSSSHRTLHPCFPELKIGGLIR